MARSDTASQYNMAQSEASYWPASEWGGDSQWGASGQWPQSEAGDPASPWGGSHFPPPRPTPFSYCFDKLGGGGSSRLWCQQSEYALVVDW